MFLKIRREIPRCAAGPETKIYHPWMGTSFDLNLPPLVEDSEGFVRYVAFEILVHFLPRGRKRTNHASA